MKRVKIIRPLYHRVIVRPDKPDEKYGNIILPPNALANPMIGTVVGTGHGILQKDGSLKPLIVKTGDRVLFHEYSGLEFFINGERFLQMGEDNLVGLIEDEEDEEGNKEVPNLRFENVT